MRGLIVLGTDTDVGKTFVASALARGLVDSGHRVGVYKPVASGVTDDGEGGDADRLWRAAQLMDRVSLERVCPQQFSAPLAPSLAARLEGRCIDEALMVSGAAWWLDQCDLLIVEGAGGVLSPLSDSLTNADLALALQRVLGALPCLIIATQRVGVVNHALLAIEALKQRQLPLLGVFLNVLPSSGTDLHPEQREAMLHSNAELIRRFAPSCRVLSELPELIDAITAYPSA